MGVAVHLPPRADRPRALAAPTSAQIALGQETVAGLAGMGAQPDLDMGRDAFHPIPPGLLYDCRMVSRKGIDTVVSVEETATQVQVIFEHALDIEDLLQLLTDERLDLDTDDPAGRSCWPSPTTDRR